MVIPMRCENLIYDYGCFASLRGRRGSGSAFQNMSEIITVKNQSQCLIVRFATPLVKIVHDYSFNPLRWKSIQNNGAPN